MVPLCAFIMEEPGELVETWQYPGALDCLATSRQARLPTPAPGSQAAVCLVVKDGSGAKAGLPVYSP